MPRRRSRKQRGSIVVVLLAVLVLFATYAMFQSLDVAAVRVARDRVTNESLAKAKEALIAYAVSDANRPGELPCPDIDDDGAATPGVEYIGSPLACASLIGRLPWRTLDLPDLRDDSGERLWYALSDDFHAGGAVALNSDTAFRTGNTSLTLTGQQAGTNLVALVFAPGAPVVRDGAATLQGRSGAGASNAANYLDVAGGQDNADANRVFAAADKSASFNDRILPVHSDDIMSLVQRRAGRELAQKLREHFALWQNATTVSLASRKGFYPYAAQLTSAIDPSVRQTGTNGNTYGLLPLGTPSIVWQSANISGGGCVGQGTTLITCTAFVIFGVGANVTGRLTNVGTGFIQPPDGTEMSTAGIVLFGVPTASPWTLNASAQALDFSSTMSFLGTGVVTIKVRAPNVVSSWVNDASYWVTANNWHQDTYYAVSGGFAIGGNGNCVPPPATPPNQPCATVANTTAPTNDKRAIVVMTGRALAGQRSRPPANTSGFSDSDYLEQATPTALAFARGMRTLTFNDLPVVVEP